MASTYWAAKSREYKMSKYKKKLKWKQWKQSNSNPHNCKKWRHVLKSAMCAASQSSGWQPTSVDNASEPAC